MPPKSLTFSLWVEELTGLVWCWMQHREVWSALSSISMTSLRGLPVNQLRWPMGVSGTSNKCVSCKVTLLSPTICSERHLMKGTTSFKLPPTLLQSLNYWYRQSRSFGRCSGIGPARLATIWFTWNSLSNHPTASQLAVPPSYHKKNSLRSILILRSFIMATVLWCQRRKCMTVECVWTRCSLQLWTLIFLACRVQL